MRQDARPRLLVQREPVTAGRAVRAQRTLRDLERALGRQASRFELCEGGREVRHPVDEDQSVTVEMIREEDSGRSARQLHHRDARPAILDRKDASGSQDIYEVPRVAGNVVAWGIQEVELLE